VTVTVQNSVTTAPTAAYHLYVSTTGSDSNAGTQSAPFRTITKASSVALASTIIHVAPGTYSGSITTSKSGTATGRITYLSDTKWGAKLVGSGSGAVWLNLGNYVTISGFDVTGSSNTAGLVSGPWNGGEVGHHFAANNNLIHDISVNTCGSSGGIHVFSATGQDSITNNIVRNVNVAQIGSCATMQGIYIASPDTYVVNNIVSGVAAVGIQQWHGATRSKIINNTTFNSKIGILIGQGDSGSTSSGSCGNIVQNNISMNNRTYGIHGTSGVACGGNQYKNNVLYGNGTSATLVNSSDIVSGNITTNPLFVNYQANGSGDYHLQSTSPAIDKGLSASAPATDFDGKARPQGVAFDIGAYER
jgi:hypothetical protein